MNNRIFLLKSNASGKQKIDSYCFFFIIFTTLFLFLNLEAFGKTAPFGPGERLRFEVRWGSIPAGEIVLEVHPPKEINGIASNHFVMIAKTNQFIDFFYIIRSRIDAYTNVEMSHSMLYCKKQREGKTRRDIVVKFDWSKGQAEYSNFGQKEKPISIFPGSFDPLSLFYAFRSVKLDKDTKIEAPVTNGKTCLTSRLKVIGREIIEIKNKKYDTYLVQPELGQVSAVFEKSKDARLRIWVTADKVRMPIKIWSKLAIGSCVAELIKVEHFNF
jgi:hypothetical protein